MINDAYLQRAEDILACSRNERRDLSEAEFAEIEKLSRQFHEARASAVRSRGDFERLLRETGFPRAAARKLSSGWSSLNPDHGATDAAERIEAAISKLKHARRDGAPIPQKD